MVKTESGFVVPQIRRTSNVALTGDKKSIAFLKPSQLIVSALSALLRLPLSGLFLFVVFDDLVLLVS
ncbi:hypothetical protein ACLBP5_30590, partial [Klebsiella pneumoniae]